MKNACGFVGLGGVFAAGLGIALAVGASPASAQLACGGTVGPTGAFELDQDLVCDDTTDPALQIVGPVVVDLRGHSISADPDAAPNVGVLVEGEGAVLRNGTIEGFGFQPGSSYGDGVVVAGTGRHLLKRLRVRNNADAGIEVREGSEHNRLAHNTLSRNGDEGINIRENVADTEIAHNKAIGNGEEGFVDGGIRSTYVRNHATGSVKVGFQIFSSAADTQLLNNVSVRNNEKGFLLGGTGALVKGNVALLNGEDGIQANSASNGTTITRNVARRNGNGETTFDLTDTGNPPCTVTQWSRNIFRTSNDPCIEGGAFAFLN